MLSEIFVSRLQRFPACDVSKSVKTAGNKSSNWENVNLQKWNLCSGCHSDLMPREKAIKHCFILNRVKSERPKGFPCVFQTQACQTPDCLWFC